MGDLERIASRGWQRIAALSPWVIVAIGWSVFVLYAYPGLMGADSFAQLDDVRAGVYRDANPPVVTLVWSILDRIIAGPFGMLVLQSTCFLGGAYLIARRLVRPRVAAVCTAIVLLLPPVLAVMAVVSPDGLLAGLGLLGLGLLLDDRRSARVSGLVVLAIAGATRCHAAAATLPIVVLAFPWPQGPRLRRYALAAGVWLALVGAAWGANALLTDREEARSPQEESRSPREESRSPISGRFERFADLIADEPPIVTHVNQAPEPLAKLDIPSGSSKLQRAAEAGVEAMSRTFLFQPWFYGVLALALLVRFWRIAEIRILLASGLAAELGLVYFARGPGYAQSCWLVATTLLAAAIIVARRRSRDPSTAGAAPDRS